MGCGASRAVIEVAITPGYENASTSSAKAAGEVASTPPSFTAAELAAKAAPTVEPESPVTTNSSSKRPEGSANAPSASPDSAAPSGPTPATQGPRPPASHRTQSLPHSASQPPSPPPSQPIRSSQSSRIFPKLPTSPGPAHPQPAALSPACPTLLTPLAKPRQGSCSNLPPLDVHPAPPPAHESQPAKSVSVSPHRISRLSTPTNHQPVTESGTGDLEEVLGRLPHALRAFWKGEFGSEDGASTERFCDAVRRASRRTPRNQTVGASTRGHMADWGPPACVVGAAREWDTACCGWLNISGRHAWLQSLLFCGWKLSVTASVPSRTFPWACQDKATCPFPLPANPPQHRLAVMAWALTQIDHLS